MKIAGLQNAISFKSGYPTFGTCGHLSNKPIYDEPYIYPGYLYRLPKPGDIRPNGGILHNLDYFA